MFQNPGQDLALLVILLVVTTLAYFVMKYLRGSRATYFGNMGTLKRTHKYKVFHISGLVLLVKVFLIVLLYLVATNSIMIKDYQPITDTDYVLLIDDSSSMAKSDFAPNRLHSAKTIATKWVDVLPNSTAVGIVGFSKNIDTNLDLTHDTDKQLEAIESIAIDYTRSGTDLNHALSHSADLLKNSKSNKTVLLFTDGTESISNDTINRIKFDNIKIIAFGIGDEDVIEQYDDIPVEFRGSFNSLAFNFTAMQELANNTNGKAYKVGNTVELEKSFNDATLEEIQVSLDSGYYVTILIAIISILELLVYAKLGAL